MKKKITLIAICVIIIIAIFVRNIMIEVNGNKKDNEVLDILNKEEVITRAQVAKMLSYLMYTKEECKALTRVISYSDTDPSLWYDKYVNAIYTFGLLEEEKEYRPLDYLTYGECKDILSKIVVTYNYNDKNTELLQYNTITSALNFNLDQAKDKDRMPTSEWIIVYQSLINHLKTAIEVKSSSEKEKSQWESIKKEELFIVETDTSNSKLEDQETITDKGIYCNEGLNLLEYKDCKIKVFSSKNEILYIESITKDEATLSNVFIISNENKDITVYIEGIKRTFTAKNPLTEDVKNVIGDLVIDEKEVVKLRIKPEVINSKVLVANNKYIELEDYGKINLDSNFKIYKTYDDLSMEVTNGILVGYDNTDFVVSNGKICAALIKDKIDAKNIRVLIKTNNFADIFHKDIKITSDSKFTIYYGDKKKNYNANKIVTIKQSSKFLKSGRIKIKTADSEGKIKILSLKRGYGNPKYRGTMEVYLNQEGLTLINELSLEEYLYSVIPSEMPVSYGLEALKVQAICARSYAYKQLLENNYSSYGAHIDDSISYQVYNNMPESKETILAVKDTYGKVLQYKNEIISAYYFSTSCGHTSSAYDVWGTDKDLEYLKGKLQTEEDVVETIANNKEAKNKLDLTNEENFRKFITNTKYNTYDKEFAWYRWNTVISKENLKKTIDQNLLSRYKANPELIQTLTKKNGKKVYQSVPIDTVGEVKEIQIANRGTGGIVNEVILIGSKNTVKVSTEYNIRTLFAPKYDNVIRKDKSVVSSLSMLPSAFFVLNQSKDGKSYTFIGGGYGHGVGMSQNGVKAMTDLGKTSDEILKFYYSGVTISNIYQ